MFKADGAETNDRYSISDWWLEPHTEGRGAHVHDDENCISHILEGTVSLLVGEEWLDAPQGTDVRSPVGVQHNFFESDGSAHGVLECDGAGDFEVVSREPVTPLETRPWAAPQVDGVRG